MLNKRYVLAASIVFFGASQWAKSVTAEEVDAGQSAALFSAQVDDQALSANRGGTLVVNDMKLDGVVSENLAANVVTGSNLVTGSSFAGASGIPTMIQNTGNNVLIQNATIVNVQLQP